MSLFEALSTLLCQNQRGQGGLAALALVEKNTEATERTAPYRT
ncbi:hypothetical protein GP5015_534 [gamma proteobacterium HTCC5015]|nr:hypothetical protein GP5015_534 [gamma proteobacterium HTCC5015]